MLQTLERGLDILQAFSEADPLRSAAELSTSTGLPISTVYRLLQTLEKRHFVEAAGNARYRLGPSMYLLAQVVRQQMSGSLGPVALPIMQHLTTCTGETTVLTQIIGDKAVCIESVESPQAVRLSFQRGRVMPLWAGASARVLLAYTDPQTAADVLAHIDNEWFASGEPVDPEALRHGLQIIRVQSYADSQSEVDAGARAIAVPVFNQDGHLLAGLSVAGPLARIGDSHVPALVELLRVASAQMSAQIA
ncbi:MAG: IclR family transcriptional regulator [Chloroflexaceae bacterium]|nr:IclR family transcriptional regulator [Chloroflexaceae bacterium]NJO05081.1 IclR family transcriptional regulator [Chloroflexaceae bacterium]